MRHFWRFSTTVKWFFHAYLLAIVKKNLRKNLAHESIGICPSPAGKFVLRNFFFLDAFLFVLKTKNPLTPVSELLLSKFSGCSEMAIEKTVSNPLKLAVWQFTHLVQV